MFCGWRGDRRREFLECLEVFRGCFDEVRKVSAFLESRMRLGLSVGESHPPGLLSVHFLIWLLLIKMEDLFGLGLVGHSLLTLLLDVLNPGIYLSTCPLSSSFGNASRMIKREGLDYLVF